MRQSRGWLWAIACVGVWSVMGSLGCGAPSVCDDDSVPSSFTINPNGSPCKRLCECNNQNYEGFCSSAGVCDSIPREACSKEGARRGCLLRPEPAGGVCRAGVQVCGDNLKVVKWGDCKPLDKQEPENTKALCGDGIDNDCDGILDKSDPDCSKFCNPGQIRPCYNGPEGTRNLGLCAAGNETCDPNTGEWTGVCISQVLPFPEVCDGKDNDCNGKIDDIDSCLCVKEGAKEPCYGGPFGTAEKGKCKIGIRICEKQGDVLRWGSCEGQVLPSQEDCSSPSDDNCNGLINEGCPCEPGSSARVCGSNLGSCKHGKQRCEGGAWSWSCEAEQGPSFEICDGRDNDCNGVEDDNLTRACQTPCGKGIERCVRGIWEACSAQAPLAEVCDGRDNDCDGRIDDGLRRLCRTDCGEGSEFCVEGRWLSCDAPKPQVETCNGKDDDCNGTIDDNVREVGQSCDNDTTQQGQCQRGKVTGCQKGALVCTSTTNPSLEICDGLDNDCDGQVDEGAFFCVQDVAGSGTSGLNEGAANQAMFHEPQGLHWDNTLGLLIADTNNHRVRLWNPSTNQVSTWAGSSQGFQDGALLAAQFNSPRAIQGPDDNGVYFVADSNNHRIRGITSAGQVASLAGSGKQGKQDGTNLLQTEWNQPSFLVLDKASLVVVDRGNVVVRTIALDTGNSSTSFNTQHTFPANFKGLKTYTFQGLRSMGYDKVRQRFYLVDAGSHQIVVFDALQRTTYTLGSGQPGFKDGGPTVAQFRVPTGIALDEQGHVYIAEAGNHAIRMVNPKGYVTTVAGTGKPGYKNGLAAYAQFNTPSALAFDQKGDLYIADTQNHRIRKLILQR